jgi:hypothetical protein
LQNVRVVAGVDVAAYVLLQVLLVLFVPVYLFLKLEIDFVSADGIAPLWTVAS